MIKPRYVKFTFNGWDTIGHQIKDKKELGEWLKDGSLTEGEILYELKTKYEVIKWKDGSLLLSEVKQ